MAIHPLLRVDRGSGHYSRLLISLLVLMLAGALVSKHSLGPIVTNLLIGLTLILSIFPIQRNRTFAYVGGALAFVTFVALWLGQFTGSIPASLVALAGGFIFFLYTAIVILVSILVRTRISIDDLAGAVSAYLLVGISGGFVFAFIDLAAGNSIINSFDAIPTPHGVLLTRPFDEYLYFSFTCLTTLGFGDLVPATALARVFAYLEAVIGQVYLTVLVARLVGLHITHSRISSD